MWSIRKVIWVVSLWLHCSERGKNTIYCARSKWYIFTFLEPTCVSWFTIKIEFNSIHQSCKCNHHVLWFSLATLLSTCRAASQVSSFKSPDINPVVCVNVTWRLASESAQSQFRNPSLAYYGAMSDVSLALMRCKQHYMNVRVGSTLSTAGNYRTETYHAVKHYMALLRCDCAITFPNVARCLNWTLSYVDKALWMLHWNAWISYNDMNNVIPCDWVQR